MQIDNIKISQEINFNGLPTWISMGATLLPNDNEKDCLRQIQKSITEYVLEENKPPANKWKIEQATGSNKSIIEEMEACTTYADIQSFRFTVKNADEQAVYETKLIELTPKK